VTTGKTFRGGDGNGALEEQARMNYLAYCAQGKDYTYLSDDLIDEMSNRTPPYEHPTLGCLRGRRSATASELPETSASKTQ
jgi:hypothetical protein